MISNSWIEPTDANILLSFLSHWHYFSWNQVTSMQNSAMPQGSSFSKSTDLIRTAKFNSRELNHQESYPVSSILSCLCMCRALKKSIGQDIADHPLGSFLRGGLCSHPPPSWQCSAKQSQAIDKQHFGVICKATLTLSHLPGLSSLKTKTV